MKTYTFLTSFPYNHKASHVLALIIIWALTNACFGADSTLSDDYQRLIDRHKQLKSQVSTQLDKLTSLENDTNLLEVSWNSCSQQKWRVLWKTTVDQAEENRARLEVERKQLFSVEQASNDEEFKLEQINQNIKHDHRKSPFERERAFRAYMHEFDNVYLYELENTYLHSLGLYNTGIEKYQSFIEFSMKCCQENNLTQAALDTAGNTANDIIEVVKAIKAILRPEATKTASPRP